MAHLAAREEAEWVSVEGLVDVCVHQAGDQGLAEAEAGRPAFPSHASVSSSRSSRSGARGRSTATAASRLPQ